MTPEDLARQATGGQPEPCGWAAQERKEMNNYAALGVAAEIFEDMQAALALSGSVARWLKE